MFKFHKAAVVTLQKVYLGGTAELFSAVTF